MATTRHTQSQVDPDFQASIEKSKASYKKMQVQAFRNAITSREQASIDKYCNNDSTWEAVSSLSVDEKMSLLKFAYRKMVLDDFKKFVSRFKDVPTVREFKQIISNNGIILKSSHIKIIDNYLEQTNSSMFLLFGSTPYKTVNANKSLKRKLSDEDATSVPEPKAARLEPKAPVNFSLTDALFSASSFFEGAAVPEARPLSQQNAVPDEHTTDYDLYDYSNYWI